MKISRRSFLRVLASAGALSALAGCGASSSAASSAAASETETSADGPAALDPAKWQYDADSDTYWQAGLSYAAAPADSSYETMGFYVPAAYFTASANGDGTYTCTVNAAGACGDYTAADAPMVIPVNTPGYSAMSAPTGYTDDAKAYTEQGFIYLYAGCRGRDAGAPCGVTDLKAALRYTRLNAAQGLLPGNADAIFSFGMSGGGAQSALLGAAGNSGLYTPYLEAIGAADGYSDAVKGSMCWCPITGLDAADEAYEWNMGMTRSGLTDEMQQLSDGLACAYADYVNAAGLTDENGNVLTLSESAEGNYQAGSYYDCICGVIAESLNNYIADSEWPLTVSASGDSAAAGGRNGGAPSDAAGGSAPADLPSGGAPSDAAGGSAPADLPSGGAPSDSTGGASAGLNEFEQADGVSRSSTSTSALSGTFDTPEAYAAALNEAGGTAWVTVNDGTAAVTGVAGFAAACKNASKDVGAFDDLNRGQAENTLFNAGDGTAVHFDETMAALLAGTDYEAAYAEDLALTDALGTSVQSRVNMYTPLYYLLTGQDGYGTAETAPFWRIRTGINQGDTSLCTEVNLKLALESCGCSVDFAAVWGQGHTQAERSGTAEENFIRWVKDCMAASV